MVSAPLQEEEFDPMKPRHQIPRSPLPVKSGLSEGDDREIELRPNCLSSFDVSLASSSMKSMASDLPEGNLPKSFFFFNIIQNGF